MKVFLTGATGFVGGHLLKALREGRHEVRCLVRGASKAWKIGEAGGSVCAGDVLEPEGLSKGMEGCEAVIHLVGIIQEVGKATFGRMHVEATRNVVDAARRAGVRRFVHMSALGARPGARSRYHQTKYEAEESLRRSGLDATIFRPSVIFGPGDGFVNLLADLIRKAPIVPILGSGTNRLQPISVYDVAQFFVRSLTEPRAIGRTYELGGPEPIAYAEIVRRIMTALGRRKPTVRIPLALAAGPVWMADKILPHPPINWDQFIMLQEDNTCQMEGPLSIFPISLMKFEKGIREYLNS